MRAPPKNSPNTQLKGFSLLEMMVAIALTLIITAAAAASTILIYRQFLESAGAARTDSEAKVLGEYIISHFRQTGGDVVRPWMSTRVINSKSAGDTFVGAEYDESFPSCAITSYSDTSAAFAISSGSCCFDASVAGHQMMMVQGSGTSWTLKNAASIDVTSCTISWANPLTDVLNNEPTNLSDFDGGTGVVVDIARIRHIASSRELVIDEDPDLDNVFDTRVIAPDIYDVQYALGFDFDPVDGRITNTRSASDEWLYNHPADTEEAGAPVPSGADRSDLRLVSIAFITGWTKETEENKMTALDGPERVSDTARLRLHRGTAYFRNDFTFQ